MVAVLFSVTPNYFLFHLCLLSPTLGGAHVLLPVQHEESPSKQGRSTSPKLNDAFISLKTHKPTVREFPHNSRLHSQQTFSTCCCVVQSWIRCTGCSPPSPNEWSRHRGICPGIFRHWPTCHIRGWGDAGALLLWKVRLPEPDFSWLQLQSVESLLPFGFLVMEAKKNMLLGVRSRCTYREWVWLLLGYTSFLLPKFYWNHLLPPLDLSSDP